MYRMHRVFCATAWELEGERLAFDDTIGQFNETVAMGRGVLYVPASLTNIRDKRPYQYLVEENIRDARYYILALGDDWGPVERNFRNDYRAALACREDPALPMQDVALLVRSYADEPSPLVADLARAGISAVPFAGIPEFREHVGRLLTSWIEIDAPAGSQTAGA